MSRRRNFKSADGNTVQAIADCLEPTFLRIVVSGLLDEYKIDTEEGVSAVQVKLLVKYHETLKAPIARDPRGGSPL